MDLSKSYNFFQPQQCESRIHIIGCGAIGSTIAENLVRFGLTNIALYDFDIVESHNIANQMFNTTNLNKTKVKALASILCAINPMCKEGLKLHEKGYINQKLSGYVFLCVDNIELRKKIAMDNQYNSHIKAMFDVRMGLTDAQHFAVDWRKPTDIKNFIGTMDFTHEEAKQNMPVSACNLALSVCPTVRVISAYAVANFINFVKNPKQLKRQILIDAFNFNTVAF